jgi:hypothetical protein
MRQYTSANEAFTQEVSMKKIFIVLVVIAGLISGYLIYDWQVTSKKRASAPVTTIYSWEDENGNIHFSDNQPPDDARDIKQTEGQKYIKPPLAVRIKETMLGWYRQVKTGISKVVKSIPKRKSKKK